jgi:hypothetical protein
MKAPSIIAAFVIAGAGLPAEARTEQCQAVTEKEITSLFEGWNAALATGDPAKVVARYATKSILLTPESRRDYFEMFLKSKPQGKIDSRFVQIGCNTALDAGVYTFTFGDGKKVQARYSYTYGWDGKQWLITSHHSSAMPESASK